MYQNIYKKYISVQLFHPPIHLRNIKFILYIRLYAIREGYEGIQENSKYFKAVTERVLQEFRGKKPHTIALHGYESIPDRPLKHELDFNQRR